MRDILLFALVFGAIPFIFIRPAIGVMACVLLGLMNPHRLAFGAAHDFPFVSIMVAVTVASAIFSARFKRIPMTPVTVTLALFALWTTFTTFFALEPDLAWEEWSRVTKTFFIMLIAVLVLRSERDIKALCAVIAISIGFYGFKGGIFTLLTGGAHHVVGPESSYIEDNNTLALALIMSLPIIWYLRQQAVARWLQLGLSGVAILTLIAAVGSYSRGALLGGAAMLLFLWMRSRQKVGTGIALTVTVLIVFAVMPDQWFSRMGSIEQYQTDASAKGRINAWYFGLKVAQAHWVGGGFSVFSPQMFLQYAPVPGDHHAAHSIYFQVLGEHGFIGLGLFLLLMAFAWRAAGRIIKSCRGRPERKWAADLAAMTQVSIVGYAVGGAFLSMAYYDLYYVLIILLVVLERHLAEVRREQGAGEAATSRPDLSRGARIHPTL
jgi:probable O-glycosylation ligase (exosortase A-associated)